MTNHEAYSFFILVQCAAEWDDGFIEETPSEK